MAIGILAAVGIGAKIGSAFFGLKAAKKSKRAAKLEAKARRLQKFVERRRLLREARQAEAVALASGVSQGVGIESSGVQGALASIGTQAREQLTVSSVLGRLEQAAGRNRRAAAKNRAISGALTGAASAASSFKKVAPGAEKTFEQGPRTAPTVPTSIETETGVTSRPAGGNVNQSPFFVNLPGGR